MLKLGGHLLFSKPDSFKDYVIVLDKVLADFKNLFIVVGGGQKARDYIKLGRELNLSEAYLDQLGIMISHVNAFLIYSYLIRNHRVKFVTSWEEFIELAGSDYALISGGLLPSISTTTVACLMAEATNAMLLYATDVEGVYDKDPKKHADAKLFKEIEIEDLIKVLRDTQDMRAGQYKLFDQHALDIMKRSKIPVRVFNGLNVENIIRAIKNENIGTLIYYK